MKNNKIILKTQRKFKSEGHNGFSEEINTIFVSYNIGKRLRSVDSIEVHANGTSKDLVCKKKEIKCNNIIKE